MDAEPRTSLSGDLDTIASESLAEMDPRAKANVLRRILPVSQLDDEVAAFNSSI